MYMNDNPTCCVTHSLLDEVSWTLPTLLRRNGEVSVYRTLFYLGFKIKKSIGNRNVSIHKDMLIRSSEDNEQCYRDTVYKGVLRKGVKDFKDGNIIYHKHEFHHLLDKYLEREVLQPSDLKDYILDQEIKWIEDFGGKSKLADCIIPEED